MDRKTLTFIIFSVIQTICVVLIAALVSNVALRVVGILSILIITGLVQILFHRENYWKQKNK